MKTPRLPPIFRQLARYARFVARHYVNDRCTNTAGMLAYTSLLSMVPLLAVAFGSLAAFPVFQSLGGDIQDFIFRNFVPAAGEAVQTHMQDFVAKASGMTLTGVIFLIITAVLLMNAIDSALNRIWRVRQRRSPIQSFLVYWAILSLGPLLVGASLALSSYIISLPLLSDAAASVGLRYQLLKLLPFMATTAAFTLLYSIIPNRHIPLRAALIGGTLAAIVFEIAKRAFAWYITTFPTYEAIYGALAAIPIFLVWVYLSWAIVLLGAEITYAIMAKAQDTPPEQSAQARLNTAYHLLQLLHHAFQQGQTPSAKQLQKQSPAIPPGTLSDSLEDLLKADWIQGDEDGYSLKRSLKTRSLKDLLRLTHSLPLGDDQADMPIEQALAHLHRCAQQSLDQPLETLLTNGPNATANMIQSASPTTTTDES